MQQSEVKPKVFVTYETNHDFSEAERYGEITFLTSDDLSNVRGSVRNEGILSNIRNKLKKFDAENDWIVVTGSPYVAAAVFLILGNRKIRSVNVLRWDNRDFVYRPMHIELRQEIKDDES